MQKRALHEVKANAELAKADKSPFPAKRRTKYSSLLLSARSLKRHLVEQVMVEPIG